MHGELRHVGDARHSEIAEVALLNLAILQGDGRARQAHRQSHHRGALHLSFDAARIHGQVAVHPGGDTVQNRLAILDRGFHDIGHHRAEGLVHRHAPGATGGQLLLAIAALVHRQLQCGGVARVRSIVATPPPMMMTITIVAAVKRRRGRRRPTEDGASADEVRTVCASG